jgi:hypothetical protein|tara:strand:+ start:412 stop:768 length:357 start_codon:yes stop_codon:yes gene_type:complete
MHPLKILAFVIIGLPVSAFLLTLFLTDGAPLQPLAPGEKGGPVVVIRTLPLAELERPNLERKGSVAAVGHSTTYVNFGGILATEDKKLLDRGVALVRMFNPDREVELFLTLFGFPQSK